MIKVLHLWKSDGAAGGGGGIAMYRLHSGLREAGIDSKILCETKITQSSHVEIVPRWRRFESVVKMFTSRLGLNDIHRVSSFKVNRHQFFQDVDIVHFHGIHSGFISYLALPSLTRSKPAVFMLHDMWSLTGHCVYSYDCERWKSGCGECPYPDTYPSIRRDNTRLEWKLKNWVYGLSKLNIVSPSIWLAEQAKFSMLKRFPIHHIPNGIDTETFEPIDTVQCRRHLEIPLDKKVVMFSAASLKDRRKGGDLLRKALESLPRSLKGNALLLLMGKDGESIKEILEIPTVDLGFRTSDRIKAMAYSAADLFVLPSRADNLPQGVQESLACGTPVVSFDIGGVPDLVRPGITGYLCEPENAIDLRNRVVRLLEDEPLRNYMKRRCREIALREYSSELQTKRYIALYRQLLHRQI